MRFDAGTVPVGYLVFSSESRSLGEIQDLALNRVRPQFATLPGLTSPPPFGGSQRTIVIRVDPDRLRVVRHVAGRSDSRGDDRQRDHAVGQRQHRRRDAHLADELGRVEHQRSRSSCRSAPAPGRRCSIRDVGSVSDSTDIPTAYALVNGRRAVYIPVTKRPNASTLDRRQRGEGESRRDSRRWCPTTSRSATSSISRGNVSARAAGGAARGGARRAADRPDGAAVSARLAQRGDRRRDDSVRAAGRGRRAVGRRPDASTS